ncbi:hypothetical protein J2851_002577 [Azospirillum rugosum]|uniref:Uncharacterized protein n=1 Tax=Azospirillum rugosum TaxID=416170 RepID=A0ABS4SJQ9_9PROT|nr:hypothetical protein [Azospirillum rugosum]MDQ0527055.1 hypothetical protein [Azospirillum rugosum]
MGKSRHIVPGHPEWLYRRAMIMNRRCPDAMPTPDPIRLPDTTAIP